MCNCVTQSSLIDIDEDVANLYCSQKRTERKRIMTKKLKVRVSAIIMCAAMLVTSMTVLAVERTDYVGLSGGTGTAYVWLDDEGVYANASSSGSSSSADLISTSIYGGCSEPVQKSGYSSVTISCDIDPFDYATSTHKWMGATHTMTIYR